MPTEASRRWRGARLLLAAGLVAGSAAVGGSGIMGGLGSPGDPGGTAQATVQTAVPVYGPLRVTPAVLPAGARGVTYPSVPLTATGGETPYTWSVVGGAMPGGLRLQPDGLLSGRPETAANPILTVQVQDSEIPPQEATAVLTLLVTAPGVHVTASSTGTSTDGVAEVKVGGTGSSTPETVAAAVGGSGSVSVAEYTGNPAPNYPAFQNAGTYFDVALSPGATFARVTIERCGLGSSPQTAYWWSTQRRAWVRATDQSFDSASGCLHMLVTATTTPSLGDLQGTYLAVGAPVLYALPVPVPGLPVPGAPTAQAAIGGAGGLLGTADGAFQMAVPAGAITGDGTVQVAEAPATAAAPPLPAYPAGMSPTSPLFVLSGAPLAGPLPATMHYDPAGLQGLSPDLLSVYALQPGGGWTPVPTAADGVDGVAEAPLEGPETVVILVDRQTFADVPAGYWAAGAIDQLTAAGVVTGFPDGTFRPEAPLTRAEFVKMLDLALGLPPGAPVGSAGFTDVPASAWFQPWVAAAVGAGIVQGTSATTFSPGAPVTREQMAVLLSRALKLSRTATPHSTDAVEIDAWAASGVDAALAAGYIQGFADGTLQPLATATRAQAARVLALVLLHRAGALQ